MNAPGKAVTAALLVCLVMVLSTLAVVATTAPVAGTLLSPTSTVSTTAAPATVAPAVHPAGGPSCTVTVSSENAGNNAIQTAINAAHSGDVICIGPGVFPEQLTISTSDLLLEGSGNATATGTVIEPAGPLVLNTYDYDSSYGATGVPAAAIVLVEGSSGTPTTGVTGVVLKNLQINGSAGASTFDSCSDGYFGLDAQASSVSASGLRVADVAMPTDDFGCQTGTGLAVYAYNGYYNFEGTNHQPDDFTLANSTITGYQKNGITCDDLGETCALARDTVTGIGGTTLTAQNGIQIGFGASAGVSYSHVTGDHYTGDVVDNADYFAPVYTATGILVYDGGNTIGVEDNILSGNDLGISLYGTANATVSDNTIQQGYSYGLTFDLNASADWLGLPVYSTDAVHHTLAADNSISNVNVGVLIYDDNVTLVGGATTNVNVSVEAMTDDAAVTYTVGIFYWHATANVSGLLLGNLSSYQSTAGFYPKAVGDYYLGGDVVQAGALAPPSGSANGLLALAQTIEILSSDFSGFVTGIYVNPTVTTAVVQGGEVASPSAFAQPTVGIWIGNQAPNPLTDWPGSVLIRDVTVLGPGGATDSPLAGSAGIIAGGDSLTIQQVDVQGFSAVLGSSPTATSGDGSGYDWWQGTQSVGLLIACPPTTTAFDCSVSQSQIFGNAIGIVVISTNSAFSSQWETGPVWIGDNQIDESGGYGLFTAMAGQGGTAGSFGQTSLITDNTFNNSFTGAVGVDLGGQSYNVSGNTFIGTSASGDQGPSQSEGGPSIATASIEATDYWVYSWGSTAVQADENFFEDTDLYCSTSFAGGTGSSLACNELVTFSESGLPSGASWSVSDPHVVQSPLEAAPGTFVVQLNNGSWSFSGDAAGYNATPSSQGFTVDGSPLAFTFDFTPTVLYVAFNEAGLPSRALVRQGWSIELDGTLHTSHTETITFALPAGTYPMLVQAPTGYVITGSTYGYWLGGPFNSFEVGHQGPVTIDFSRGHTKTLTVAERGVGHGATWCVQLDGDKLCTSHTSLKYKGLTPGTYTSFSVVSPIAGETISAKVGTSPLSLPGSLDLLSSERVRLTFLHAYAVEFTESGLSSGTWSITVRGVTESSAAGDPIFFHLGNGTYTYRIGTENGYSSSGTPRRVTVDGAGTSVSVTFAPRGHLPASGEFLSAAPAAAVARLLARGGLAELAAAALGLLGVAGVALGLLAWAGRRRSE